MECVGNEDSETIIPILCIAGEASNCSLQDMASQPNLHKKRKCVFQACPEFIAQDHNCSNEEDSDISIDEETSVQMEVIYSTSNTNETEIVMFRPISKLAFQDDSSSDEDDGARSCFFPNSESERLNNSDISIDEETCEQMEVIYSTSTTNETGIVMFRPISTPALQGGINSFEDNGSTNIVLPISEKE